MIPSSFVWYKIYFDSLKSSPSKLIKEFLSLVLRSPGRTKISTLFNAHNVQFYSIERSDYREIIEYNSPVKYWNLQHLSISKIADFRIKNLGRVSLVVKYLVSRDSKFLIEGLKEFQYEMNSIVEMLDIATKVRFFNSTMGLESILATSLEGCGIKTTSLTHSFINVDYVMDTPIDSINKINVVSYETIVWSDLVRTEMISLYGDSRRFTTGGYPFIFNGKMRHFQEGDAILVVLPRDIYSEGIDALLRIISDLDTASKIYVREHPTVKLSVADYHEGLTWLSKGSLSEAVDDLNIGLVIGYNTMAYFNALALGIIALHFTYLKNECFPYLDDGFSNVEELALLLTKVNDIDYERRDQVLGL